MHRSSLSFRPFLLLSFALISLSYALPLFSAEAATMPSTLTLRAADYQEKLSGNDIGEWFHMETKLARDTENKQSEIEDTSYCPTKTAFCLFSLSRDSRSRLTVQFRSEPNKENIDIFIKELSGKVNQDPVDAIFGTDSENRIIVLESEKLGRALKEEESATLLLQALTVSSHPSIEVSLPTVVVEPKILGSDKERLGLKELIGEGKSNFKGSPKNRIFNIKRALEQYQSILIAPGAEFSFVDHLGEVDGEHGYLPELVIKHNRTEPEFGGGICQVSSTVFRAAIYSGLKITERRNHAYAVQYYKPIGMDATIYIPKPDLKFTNNTPGYILMQSSIDDAYNLTFRFFGTKDGRQTRVDGPHVLERGEDGSMKTVFTQLVTDNAGNDFIKDSFWSNYKSPSLFPHPTTDTVLTEKPKDWSEKQWREYQKIR